MSALAAALIAVLTAGEADDRFIDPTSEQIIRNASRVELFRLKEYRGPPECRKIPKGKPRPKKCQSWIAGTNGPPLREA